MHAGGGQSENRGRGAGGAEASEDKKHRGGGVGAHKEHKGGGRDADQSRDRSRGRRCNQDSPEIHGFDKLVKSCCSMIRPVMRFRNYRHCLRGERNHRQTLSVITCGALFLQGPSSILEICQVELQKRTNGSSLLGICWLAQICKDANPFSSVKSM